MNVIMEKKETSNVEVVLIVPFGVEPQIYPWGAITVKEYLGNTCPLATVTMIDFQSDGYIKDLNDTYSELLTELFSLLTINQVNTFFGTIGNPYVFLGTVAFEGNDFLKQINKIDPLSSQQLQKLQKLQDDVIGYISGKINEYAPCPPENPRLWAFSVYDRTLFNCLHIAKLIKKVDKEASIILGGDYFNFDAAEETFKKTDFIDGVVVGYGEDVMAYIVEKLANINSTKPHPKGLVDNRYFISRSNSNTHNSICKPPHYDKLKNADDFLSTNQDISYVQLNNNNSMIQILSQRGCRYGECKFCTQMDKTDYSQISAQHLIDKITPLLKAGDNLEENKVFKISFDSDENNIAMLLQFLNYLDTQSASNLIFEINLWLQIKMFTRRLVKGLLNLTNKNIRIFFKLNFESLNDQTLDEMAKGHRPLKAIQTAKTALDLGYSFSTNYFIHFPLESSEDIQLETEMMESAAHLFMPPDGNFLPFPYGCNNRDSLYRAQDKYKIEIHRLPDDNWLQNTFDVNLPYSQWAFYYVEKSGEDIDRKLIHHYYEIVKLNHEISTPGRLAKSCWGQQDVISEKTSAKEKLRKEQSKYDSLCNDTKGQPFKRRTQLFNYFADIQNAEDIKKKSDSPTRQVKITEFKIAGKDLIQKWGIPGEEKEMWRTLTFDELNVLRCLYWTRKKQYVYKKLEMDNGLVDRIIDDHIQLGTIVEYDHPRFGRQFLCVANDPEAAKMKETWE